MKIKRHYCRTKKVLLAAIFIMFVTSARTQGLSKSKYVVFTIVEFAKNSLHGSQEYLWIIPIDSINSYENSIYPVFLSYSKTQIADCKKGKSVNPTILSLEPGDYKLDSIKIAAINSFTELIQKEKTLVQSIKKTWDKKSEITVNIYATPIISEFCFCNYLRIEKPGIYSGLVFLIDGFTKIDNAFWNMNIAKYILKRDYSSLNFKQIYYP